MKKVAIIVLASITAMINEVFHPVPTLDLLVRAGLGVVILLAAMFAARDGLCRAGIIPPGPDEMPPHG
jgi:hypothetical protein